MTVSILGTDYSVAVKKYSEDGEFERLECGGYCSGSTKRIVLCDMSTYPGWEHEEADVLEIVHKRMLRHEITHAFLEESGLSDNSGEVSGAWARNEEMVDWIAIQGPKIYAAWQRAGCL